MRSVCLVLIAGWFPALFVRYDWPVGGAGVTTPLVTATHGPLAGCSQAVKWFHCLHLPLALQSGVEQQRQAQLVTSDAVSVALGTSPAAVVFQVRKVCGRHCFNTLW